MPQNPALPKDDTDIEISSWANGGEVAAPHSHPIVGEKPEETAAALKQKEESLKHFSRNYPHYDKVWWDDKNKKVHKYKNFGNKK